MSTMVEKLCKAEARERFKRYDMGVLYVHSFVQPTCLLRVYCG